MSVVDDWINWLKMEFWRAMEYIKALFAGGLIAITDFVGAIIIELTRIFAPVLQFIIDVKDSVVEIVGAIYDWMAAQAKALIDLADSLLKSFVDELALVLTDITDFIDDVKDTVLEWISGLGTEIKGYFDLGIEMLKQFFLDVWEGVKNFMIYLKNQIMDGFKTVIDWILVKITALFTLVKESFGNIKDYMIGLWESFKLYMSETVESFKRSVSDLYDIVIEFFDTLWEDIKVYIDGLVDVTEDQIATFIETSMKIQLRLMKKLAAELG
ncbi:hypothetical protein ES703_48966 [subsurface metagenome]